MKCIAKTNKGTRCTRNAKNDTYCGIHQKIVNGGGIVQQYEVVNPIEPDNPVNPDNPDEVFECGCCFEELDRSDIIHCNGSANPTKDHVSCVDCAKSYIDQAINNKQRIKCMFKCEHEYDRFTISKIIDDDRELLIKYAEYSSVDVATSLAQNLSNYHTCPFCSRWGIIIDNVYPPEHPQSISDVRCGICDIMFCIICRKSYHGNDSCNKIDTSNKDMIRLTIDRVIDDATIHKCPKCYTKYSKDDGCNFMTCPSCNTYSCYLCNMILVPRNGLKYWHFSDRPNSCSLYNHVGRSDDQTISRGNINYNNARVIKALKNILIENNRSDINKALRLDIKNRGYNL